VFQIHATSNAPKRPIYFVTCSDMANPRNPSKLFKGIEQAFVKRPRPSDLSYTLVSTELFFGWPKSNYIGNDIGISKCEKRRLF
jgi:hypothetical protein